MEGNKKQGKYKLESNDKDFKNYSRNLIYGGIITSLISSLLLIFSIYKKFG